jgi:hypothetical protein
MNVCGARKDNVSALFQQVLSLLPSWFKNARNATVQLLSSLKQERLVDPQAELVSLLRKKHLWKSFYRIFPLKRDAAATSTDPIFSRYIEWVRLVMEYDADNPHTDGATLFNTLSGHLRQGTFYLLPLTRSDYLKKIKALWVPPVCYTFSEAPATSYPALCPSTH